MISGESLQVSVKFQTPYQTRFRVPGFMAGNVLPKWKDNSGSIRRRLVIFRFDQRIEKTDALLGRRLIEEIPAFIVKVNKAYMNDNQLTDDRTAFESVGPTLVRYGVTARRQTIVEDGMEIDEDVFTGVRIQETRRAVGTFMDDGL